MKLFGNGFEPEKKLELSRQHKKRIESYICPKCEKKQLKVLLLEEGCKGWEARVECGNCHMKSVVNHLGFKMDFTGE